MPFQLTPEMRKWAHEHVPAVGGPDLKLDMLLRALLASNGGVKLVYESGHTGTAEEVFASGRANCLPSPTSSSASPARWESRRTTCASTR